MFNQIEKNLIPPWIFEIIEETYQILEKDKVKITKTDEISQDEFKIEIFPLSEVSVTLMILNKLANKLQKKLKAKDEKQLTQIIKDIVLAYPLILSAIAIAMSNLEILEKSDSYFKGIVKEVKEMYNLEESLFWSLIEQNPQQIGLDSFSEEDFKWLNGYQTEAMEISKAIIDALSGGKEIPQKQLEEFIIKYIQEINNPVNLLLITSSIADASYLLILLKMYPQIFVEIREKLKDIKK